MARAAGKVFDDIAAKARSTDHYIQRMEKLHTDGLMSQADVLRAYSGAFLTFHSFTENSLENLFLGLVGQRIDHPDRRVRTLVSIPSSQTVRRVVFASKSYADWIPIHRFTLPRAETFLSSGRPFTSLSKAHCKHLDGMGTIRNALAHESGHALRLFERTFVEGKPLPPSQRKPAGYLRGRHAATQTRLNYLFSETLSAFRILCGR